MSCTIAYTVARMERTAAANRSMADEPEKPALPILVTLARGLAASLARSSDGGHSSFVYR